MIHFTNRLPHQLRHRGCGTNLALRRRGVERLVREGIHEPGEGEGENDENEEVAEGGEDALFGRGMEDAGEDDGDEQRAEKQKGEVGRRELQ